MKERLVGMKNPYINFFFFYKKELPILSFFVFATVLDDFLVVTVLDVPDDFLVVAVLDDFFLFCDMMLLSDIIKLCY